MSTPSGDVAACLRLVSFLVLSFLVGPSVYGHCRQVVLAPGFRLHQSDGVDLTPPLPAFLASKHPRVCDEFDKTYWLPVDFEVALKSAAKKSPVNSKTGNHILMFTIFDCRQAELAANLLCSSRAVGVPANLHVFIALDKQAQEKLLPHCPNVLLCDVSGRGYKYDEFCRLKMFVQYRLLLWGVETVVCDDDVVILRNPIELFRQQSHFELSTECQAAAFGASYSYDRFNVGFMRAIPTVASISAYEYWIRSAVPTHTVLEQDVIQRVMKPLKISGNSNIQKYRLPTGQRVVFRYYEPTDVVNGGLLRDNRLALVRHLRRRGSEKPFVVHEAWIGPAQKIPFLKSMGLWFLVSGRCNVSSVPELFPP